TFTESIWNACSCAASLRRRPTEGLNGLGPNPCEVTARRRASASESVIDLDSFISTLHLKVTDQVVQRRLLQIYYYAQRSFWLSTDTSFKSSSIDILPRPL